MPEDRELPNEDGLPTDEVEIEFLDDDDEGEVIEEEPTGVELASKETPEDEAASLKAELDQVRDIYLRKLAEFDNFRKRVDREREDYRQAGVEDMVGDLLPILDNFDRALQHAEDDSGALLQGVEMISRQLWDVLERRGVEEINPVGEEFNPELHEAVQRVEDDKLQPGTVAWVMLKGYAMGDRLIRPAMVGVAVEPGGDSNGEGGGP
jgi:molecular chaperone GrpE